ncbi:MAG: putative toxin-antitoxin system toxin component, PIN family [Candidatus Dormibacteria bacterium]
MPEPFLVVIDPNVLVSALINPYGAPARVVALLITGQVVAVIAQELLDELMVVLVRSTRVNGEPSRHLALTARHHHERNMRRSPHLHGYPGVKNG